MRRTGPGVPRSRPDRRHGRLLLSGAGRDGGQEAGEPGERPVVRRQLRGQLGELPILARVGHRPRAAHAHSEAGLRSVDPSAPRASPRLDHRDVRARGAPAAGPPREPAPVLPPKRTAGHRPRPGRASRSAATRISSASVRSATSARSTMSTRSSATSAQPSGHSPARLRAPQPMHVATVTWSVSVVVHGGTDRLVLGPAADPSRSACHKSGPGVASGTVARSGVRSRVSNTKPAGQGQSGRRESNPHSQFGRPTTPATEASTCDNGPNADCPGRSRAPRLTSFRVTRGVTPGRFASIGLASWTARGEPCGSTTCDTKRTRGARGWQAVGAVVAGRGLGGRASAFQTGYAGSIPITAAGPDQQVSCC